MLKLEGIKKEYDVGGSKVPALAGIDLEVKKGDFLGIMGPSGSGKSTLLHVLGLLDVPTEGRYFLEEHEVQSLGDGDKARLRNRHFGFIFQSFYLLPEYSALENVMLPLTLAGVPHRERKERAAALLEKVGLTDRMKYFPSMMSGGQQQRVAIARSLANEPDVIFADEPTGNLPLAMGEEILGLLKGLNDDGVTIVMVTHDDRLARHASHIIRVQDGLVVDGGASA